MDQHTPDILPSVELPSPQPEQTPEASQPDTYSEHEASKQAERIPTSKKQPGDQPQPQPLPVQAPMVTPHDAPAAGLAGITVTPQIADDTDLIEKEWVDRAKRIVEHTRNDPHQQTKEMNTMKADYLKKRYNKDLKLSE